MRKVKGCRLLIKSEPTASLPVGGPESPGVATRVGLTGRSVVKQRPFAGVRV